MYVCAWLHNTCYPHSWSESVVSTIHLLCLLSEHLCCVRVMSLCGWCCITKDRTKSESTDEIDSSTHVSHPQLSGAKHQPPHGDIDMGSKGAGESTSSSSTVKPAPTMTVTSELDDSGRVSSRVREFNVCYKTRLHMTDKFNIITKLIYGTCEFRRVTINNTCVSAVSKQMGW